MARLLIPSLAVLAPLLALSALPAQARTIPMTCKATIVAPKTKAGNPAPVKFIFQVGLPVAHDQTEKSASAGTVSTSELPVGTPINVVGTRPNSPASKVVKSYKTTDPLKAGSPASFVRDQALGGPCTATATL